jgi:hypothetical protein
MPLVPGVDTVLVAAGPITDCDPGSCQSDDAYPGTGMLNSRLSFEALVDGEVSITIYNKGEFGEGMTYYIICEEEGAAPSTPVPATATPAFTPTPTATYTPASASLWRRVGLAAPMYQSTELDGPSEEGTIEFTLMLRLRDVAP